MRLVTADTTPEPEDQGNRGGPGTFRGVDYQVKVAVLRAIRLVRKQFSAPHLEASITLERSVQIDVNVAQAWDIVVDPPRERVECKVSPTSADLREWIGVARATGGSGVTLVFGRESGTMLGVLRRLKRKADVSERLEFDLYVSNLKKRVDLEVLGLLGSDAYNFLRAITLEFVPESMIVEHILSTTESFAGEEGARRLVDMLCSKFLEGASERKRHVISDLVAEARAEGIALEAPAFANARDLPKHLRSAFALVQTLPASLPTEVLAAALRMPEAELLDQLQPYIENHRVELVDGKLAMASLWEKLIDPRAEDVEARALTELLVYVEANKRSHSIDTQVDNVVALAKRRGDSHPETVAVVFRVLDKLLKRRGDPRLVYEVADRCIRAANHATRSDQVVEGHAVSLICGRSWALQRRGELEKARADGEQSLEIGEAIGWSRNTAYCHKCLGRLRRLEAERLDPIARAQALRESAALLRAAIEEFGRLKFESEVGDSYSLLGRTYLVAGQLDDAERAIGEATVRLTDTRDKDYLDLKVLEGDVANACGRTDDALSCYSEAIDAPASDAMENEIRGRGLHARGLCHAERGDTAAAHEDFTTAAQIFQALDDIDMAAKPELELARLDGHYPEESATAELLSREPEAVRAAAVRLHAEAQRYVVAPPSSPLAAADQETGNWVAAIDEARREVTRRRRMW
jgi:tetratricopeptide (TPR) repeat protein